MLKKTSKRQGKAPVDKQVIQINQRMLHEKVDSFTPANFAQHTMK